VLFCISRSSIFLAEVYWIFTTLEITIHRLFFHVPKFIETENNCGPSTVDLIWVDFSLWRAFPQNCGPTARRSKTNYRQRPLSQP